MTRRIIATDGAPEAVGPYSQATATGDLLFCSGQIALDPTTGELLKSSIEEETRRCLDNLTAVLTAAGTGWSNVVHVRAYLTNIDDYGPFNEAYAAYAGSDPPARAAVGVAALPKGARVEIECVATL
ncbi:MAG: Rid family detoxifying hydrolase [Actinomycetota bacterium]